MTRINKQTIRQFILDGVAEGLTDKEMAEKLGVGRTTIHHRRTVHGIAYADRFERRFERKYGLIKEFKQMVERGTSLQTIGSLYGFSGEYARQVFYKLYGMGHRDYTRSLQEESQVVCANTDSKENA